MAFDIQAAIFDEDGTYLEEPATRYEANLLDQFAASRSAAGAHRTRNRTGLGRSGAPLCHHLPRRAPPMMTTRDLEEVVYNLFPRKVVTEPGDGAEIIQELQAFWQFLHRAYHLPRATQMLALLTPQAARRLERKRQDPRQFGVGKVFVLLGQEAGFDLESPEDMQAWVEVYNATVAPRLAEAARHPGPSATKPARGRSTGRLHVLRRQKRRPPPQ